MLAPLIQFVILVMLGAGVALADEPATAQDLEGKGAIEVAHGRLIQEVHLGCLPMPLLQDPGCGPVELVYGEFRRLKLHDSEFVCISFRHWACFESR